MKVNLLSRLLVFFFAAFLAVPTITFAQPCSDAGVASASADTICPGAGVTLQLTAYIGAIQWQSFDGSNWNDEIGVGSTTDSYFVIPFVNTEYRAVVTDVGCDPDTSAIVFVQIGGFALTVGVASVSEDTLCPNAPTNLLLTNYVGFIIWQSYNGTAWVNETGPGATTDNYLVTPLATTDYRALVTDLGGCVSDTTNIVNVQIGVPAPTGTGATRCGYGPVTVSASGSGIRWYDVPTGGVSIGNGSNYTTNIAATTTFYAAASSNGGGAGVTPMPPQNSTFTTNARGYFFIAPIDFTITGLFVPGTTPNQNIAVVRFDNQTPPPFFAVTTNAFVTLFLTQQNPSTGVIPVNLQVLAGDVIGVLATRGFDENAYATSPATTTIDGNTVTISRMGMQFPLASIPPQDLWQEAGGSISLLEITYEVGCESPRIPVIADVTPAPAFSLSAVPPALCQGQSSVITTTSTNPNYNYTWSPATGLSSTTGTSVTANPMSPITYTVVADDGTCGYIDSVFMDVGPASVAGLAVLSTDTICIFDNATLFLNGNTGNIQWQSFNGTAWVDETGTGSTTNQYMVSPGSGNILYRAVVTSGGCDPDTTNELSLEVLAIFDPVTVGDSICGPGVVNLSASGTGILNWYTTAAGGVAINTGTTYSPSINTTTTYYVDAAAGSTFQVGPPTLMTISPMQLMGNDWGLQFDVAAQVTLESVDIFPNGISGSVTINLRDAQGGAVLNTYTMPITGATGPITVPLGFTLNPGIGYRLEYATGSPIIWYNSFGAAFPYVVANSPLTITGAIIPGFTVGNQYYFFYNWIVAEGCKSNKIPVTGVVLSPPPVPTIAPLWNTLYSSSPTGNQWYLNGSLIPGATSQVYIATQAGTYTVVVTDANGCSSESLPSFSTGIQEQLASNGFAVYPNPVQDKLIVELSSYVNKDGVVRIFDVLGHLLRSIPVTEFKNELNFDLPAGTYHVQINADDRVFRTVVVKL